jgi:hypothetical protein
MSKCQIGPADIIGFLVFVASVIFVIYSLARSAREGTDRDGRS